MCDKIESQPKKVVVQVVVFVLVVAIFVVGLVVVIIVGHKNLRISFGQNWVSNTLDIAAIEFVL